MHRFFIETKNIKGSQATLSGPEAHHLRTIRLSCGDTVELYDGQGGVYRAEVSEISRSVQLTIHDKETFLPSTPSLCIGQGLLKGKKMDFLLQKSTELGVASFIPFYSSHCAAPPVKSSKHDRWHKIMLEACKQSGRPIPLEIRSPVDLDDLMAEAGNYSIRIIFWEKEEETRLQDLGSLASTASIIALVGPEGGFSDEEIDRAIAAGFTPVTLGSRTLRAETATLSAITLLQFLGGNL